MKLIQTLFVLLVTMGALAVTACKSDWAKAKEGYEVAPSTQADYLSSRLLEDLGFSGFDAAWLQKAWVNGFQDHTYLFVVDPSGPALKASIEKSAGSKPISASYFRDGGYLGPSSAPQWWDTPTIDGLGSRYFQKKSRLWRFTWIDDDLYIVLSES